MGLKTYKPYTKSTRTTILVDRKGIWKGSPIKSLTRGKRSSGGRNNLGRITSRSKGAGHKKRYRIIDFYRNKVDVMGKVERIEYDPNRTSYIALIKYEDNTQTYIICPHDLKVGDSIVSGKAKEIVAVTVGDDKAQETVRKALAVGADKGIHVKVEGIVEPLAVSKILQKIVEKEKPDLVFMGKQAIDDDCNQTGQMLAALLNWPQATFASKIEVKDKSLEVTREVDELSLIHISEPTRPY